MLQPIGGTCATVVAASILPVVVVRLHEEPSALSHVQRVEVRCAEPIAADNGALAWLCTSNDDIAKSVHLPRLQLRVGALVRFTLNQCIPDEPADLVETGERHDQVLDEAHVVLIRESLVL